MGLSNAGDVVTRSMYDTGTSVRVHHKGRKYKSRLKLQITIHMVLIFESILAVVIENLR